MVDMSIRRYSTLEQSQIIFILGHVDSDEVNTSCVKARGHCTPRRCVEVTEHDIGSLPTEVLYYPSTNALRTTRLGLLVTVDCERVYSTCYNTDLTF